MASPPDDRLDSWKEIAAYLKRGVRTVRRWERDEGLPVHRHVHRVLGSVYAYKSEIDEWQNVSRSSPARPPSGRPRRSSAPTAKSIAVLPFANLSTDRENEYFADGLTDELTSGLSRIAALRVTSRTSAMTFKGSNKDADTIARELGVRYIIEGSVRRAGDRLRIAARLIDGAADALVWADTWDGSVEDVFAIQERLSRVIIGALEVRLTASEDRRLADRPIDNLHAYECYVRARQEAWRWRRDAIDHAIQLLRNGLSLVGDNVRLYAALGHAYLQYREAGIDVTDAPVDEAEACASRIFSLEPASAPGFQLRGWIHYCRGDIQNAVRDLNRALAVEGNNADTLLLLANCYLISGRVSAARPLIARTLQLDPLTPLTRCMPAFADVMEGKRAAAIEPYRADVRHGSRQSDGAAVLHLGSDLERTPSMPHARFWSCSLRRFATPSRPGSPTSWSARRSQMGAPRRRGRRTSISRRPLATCSQGCWRKVMRSPACRTMPSGACASRSIEVSSTTRSSRTTIRSSNRSAACRHSTG